MAIDTSIYQNLLRPPKSIAEYDAEAQQSQQNKLALMMNQAKMADYQREQADEQTMRGAVASFGADKTANYNALLKTGNLKAAQGYEKQNADTAKVQREAEKEAFTIAKQKLELFNNAIAGAVDQNSYSRQRQILAAQGIDISQIPEQFDPGYVQAAKTQALTELQRVEQFGKERKFDQDKRKFTYQQTNDAADRGVQVRGQNMTASTAAAGRAQSASQFNQRLAVDKGDMGPSGLKGSKAPAGYRWTAGGDLEAIRGGPADIKNSAEAVKKVSEAKDVLGLLDDVDALLPKGTNGMIGTGVDKLLGAGGMSTEGGRTTAQLKALEGALISKMPKMSGPQSDKDVLLYKQMAGQVGDSTIPVTQRQAASTTIRRLNEKYAGVSPGSSDKTNAAYSDAEKERRYQEYKSRAGK